MCALEGTSVSRHAARTAGWLAGVLEAPLVLVHTRGRGVVGSMLLGSVSTGLVHAAGRPALLIPASAGAARKLRRNDELIGRGASDRPVVALGLGSLPDLSWLTARPDPPSLEYARHIADRHKTLEALVAADEGPPDRGLGKLRDALESFRSALITGDSSTGNIASPTRRARHSPVGWRRVAAPTRGRLSE